MIAVDFARPFHIARLRLRVLGFGGAIATLGGFLKTGNPELEHLVAIARERASLAKQVLFLSRTQQVFHLWHVVHRLFVRGARAHPHRRRDVAGLHVIKPLRLR